MAGNKIDGRIRAFMLAGIKDLVFQPTIDYLFFCIKSFSFLALPALNLKTGNTVTKKIPATLKHQLCFG
jgi:hypothetical protein